MMRAPLLLPLALAHLAGTALGAINWDIYEHGVAPTFKWSRPFPDDGTDPSNVHVNCRHAASFRAKMYKLADLPDAPPAGLAPWRDAIEGFLRNREYVGSWDGVDHKGLDRELVVMEWTDVPAEVRAWIEEQQRDVGGTNEERWLFGVFEKPKEEGERVLGTVRPKATAVPVEQGQEEVDKVPEVADKDKIVVFPAGAIYEILPLWVAKGSGCERRTPSPSNPLLVIHLGIGADNGNPRRLQQPGQIQAPCHRPLDPRLARRPHQTTPRPGQARHHLQDRGHVGGGNRRRQAVAADVGEDAPGHQEKRAEAAARGAGEGQERDAGRDGEGRVVGQVPYQTKL